MKNNIHKVKHFLDNHKKQVFLAVAVIAILAVSYELGAFSKFKFFNKPEGEAVEIKEIKLTQDLKVQSELYKKLILRVGAEQAQEDLFRSGLPFTGQTHLLNHVVGDVLYERYGSAGLPKCRDYFLSSCYHGFILHAIAKGGIPEVAKSFNECLKYGQAVSSQCAHAIGHGFLANAGYKNLPEALKTCDEAAAQMPRLPAFNCYDGVFMENIWAVHDDGQPSPDRWVKEDDHFYPCNDPSIDKKYLLGCWSNQPSLAYQQFKGDIKKVADEVCNKVEDKTLQNMCFDGLARQIHPITRGEVERTFNLCGLMPGEKWVNFCITVNANSSYSVGDRTSPFLVCARTSGQGKTDCYARLIGTIKVYKKPNENLIELCSKITDEEWRVKCEANN